MLFLAQKKNNSWLEKAVLRNCFHKTHRINCHKSRGNCHRHYMLIGDFFSGNLQVFGPGLLSSIQLSLILAIIWREKGCFLLYIPLAIYITLYLYSARELKRHKSGIKHFFIITHQLSFQGQLSQWQGQLSRIFISVRQPLPFLGHLPLFLSGWFSPPYE